MSRRNATSEPSQPALASEAPGPPTYRERSVARELIAATAFALLGACLLAVDVPLGRWFASSEMPGDLRKLLMYSEVFGHGFGVGLIIVTAGVLDRRGVPTMTFLAAYAFGSGMAANLLKFCVARLRPRECLADFQWGWESFVGWWPHWNVPGYAGLIDGRYDSFPSAHAATAAGLAIGLSHLYPRGRALFVLFAALAGLQRCLAKAHFASDVVWGIALGLLVGFCLRPWLRSVDPWLTERAT